jgi:hypothetical protein
MFRRNIVSAIADLPLSADGNQNLKQCEMPFAEPNLIPATFRRKVAYQTPNHGIIAEKMGPHGPGCPFVFS